MSLVIEHVKGGSDGEVTEWFGPFDELVPQGTGRSISVIGGPLISNPRNGHARIVSFNPKIHARTISVTVELTEAEAADILRVTFSTAGARKLQVAVRAAL